MMVNKVLTVKHSNTSQIKPYHDKIIAVLKGITRRTAVQAIGVSPVMLNKLLAISEQLTVADMAAKGKLMSSTELVDWLATQFGKLMLDSKVTDMPDDIFKDIGFAFIDRHIGMSVEELERLPPKTIKELIKQMDLKLRMRRANISRPEREKLEAQLKPKDFYLPEHLRRRLQLLHGLSIRLSPVQRLKFPNNLPCAKEFYLTEQQDS